MMSSNIIYEYSCNQVSGQYTYIGETQQHLISRICEHKGISPRTSMPFSNPPFTNIREHALSFDYPIKVDNFSVLARCPSHDLRLLESIFIHKFSQTKIIKLALSLSKFFYEELFSFMDISFLILLI